MILTFGRNICDCFKSILWGLGIFTLIILGLGIFTGYTMGGVIHDIKENKALKVQSEIGQLKNGVGK
jgi:hypothetical protein